MHAFGEDNIAHFFSYEFDCVVTIVYDKTKKLLAESRTMSLSLRRFVALQKIVQTDYQPRRPQDKTAQIIV